ncbi:hypothetical protein [Alkalihalobacillus sp. R86527]|uniref:hypothetical protein n=1 Tax=Alkalihalobacillus sp. R86527 TaxID=3093863 RepID=UPI00366D3B2D
MNMYNNPYGNQHVQGAMQGANMPNQQVQGTMHGPNMPNPQVQGAMQGPNMPNPQVQGAMQGPNMPNPQVQGAMKELSGDMKKLCKKYNNYHANVRMSDGMEYEGIIMDSDSEHVSLLLPQEVEEEETERQYGYGRRRYRRYGRYFFPLAGIAALSLIPYYRPYPYYGYPPYGYPYY